MKKLSKYSIAVMVIFGLTIILNLIAFSKAFCDWYTVTIYRAINAFIGTLTGWSKIAIGEIIMYIGAALLLFLVIFGIVRLILLKKKGFAKFYSKYAKTCLIIILAFLLVYTTNWFIPIRGNVLKIGERTVYTNEELEAIRTMVVLKLNEIAEQIDRDERGRVITDFTQEEIFAEMRARSDEFPKLKGHYSPVKEAICSPILEMMGIGGYNYIYTMEPTCNKYLSSLYEPVLMSHELSHHKGYYYENEATFISSVVLSESDNLYFQYCGYREIYRYIEGDCYENYFNEKINDPNLRTEFYELAESAGLNLTLDYNENVMVRVIYKHTYPQLSELVTNDSFEAYEESEAEYHADVSEEVEQVVAKPIGEVADKGWEVQGDLLKENTYSGMVLMILQYYYERQ